MFNFLKDRKKKKQIIEEKKEEELSIQLQLINSNVYIVPNYKYTFIVLGLKYPKNLDMYELLKFLSLFECKKIVCNPDNKYYNILIIGNSHQIFKAVETEEIFISDIMQKFKDILRTFPQSYFRTAIKYKLMNEYDFANISDRDPRIISGLLCNYDDPKYIKEQLKSFGVNELYYPYCTSISFNQSLKEETYSIYDYINLNHKDEYYDKLKEEGIITEEMETICIPKYKKLMDESIESGDEEQFYEDVDEIVEKISDEE